LPRLYNRRVVVLFTDFGDRDIYVGQVKAVLAARAPRVPVLDATHDVASFAVEPAAHLLAALAGEYPRGSVFLAVVDPGVGGPRDAIVVEADARSFVGPDNGLLSIVWQRAHARRCWSIVWRPRRLSGSFHGRDLFAPVAAALAARRLRRGWLAAKAKPDVLLDPADLPCVIHVDHYGNAMTGIRFAGAGGVLRVGGRALPYAHTFEDAARPFWYGNSMGLIEIAAPRASAARRLRLRVGSRVSPPQLRRSRSRGSR
jgi:S-adenosylmethionine hydrolase